MDREAEVCVHASDESSETYLTCTRVSGTKHPAGGDNCRHFQRVDRVVHRADKRWRHGVGLHRI